jgi:hypothetical protein
MLLQSGFEQNPVVAPRSPEEGPPVGATDFLWQACGLRQLDDVGRKMGG